MLAVSKHVDLKRVRSKQTIRLLLIAGRNHHFKWFLIIVKVPRTMTGDRLEIPKQKPDKACKRKWPRNNVLLSPPLSIYVGLSAPYCGLVLVFDHKYTVCVTQKNRNRRSVCIRIRCFKKIIQIVLFSVLNSRH